MAIGREIHSPGPECRVRDDADVPVPPATAAGLVLVLLQGFTVTAVTRPADLPQPAHLDAAIAALVKGLFS